MICPGRPFWWANHYYREVIEGLENWCGISGRSNYHTPRSQGDALKLIIDKLNRSTDNTNNDLPGESEFFSRVQKLTETVFFCNDNTEVIRLMVQAVRLHFDADSLMLQRLNERCRQEYQAEAAKDTAALEIELPTDRQWKTLHY